MRAKDLPPDVFIGVVDSALLGSEFGLEAWRLIKLHLLLGEPLSIEDLERLEDLLDSALDDLEGPQFRVDLVREKTYG